MNVDEARLKDEMRRLMLSSLRIMVVEKGGHMRELLKQLLRTNGVQTLRDIRTLDEAIDLFHYARYDIAIVDRGVMPDMSPALILGRLQTAAQKQGHSLKIVFVTDQATQTEISQARGAGAGSILLKPFTPKALMDHLAKLAMG